MFGPMLPVALRFTIVALLLASGAARRAASDEPNVAHDSWTQLPALPEKEGLASCFAGVSHGAILVGGGANFPDKKPWQGGTKVWHDAIYLLTPENEASRQGAWRLAGKLPRPLAYGVSATWGEKIVCVGGSDAARHYAEVFTIEWKADRPEGSQVVVAALPDLPVPLANMCGAMVDDVLYIAGGSERPDAKATSRSVFRLALNQRPLTWSVVPDSPLQPRMLAMAASVDGAFHLMGGVDLDDGANGQPKRRYLADAHRYHPKTGWSRLPDLPSPLAAVASPAPSDGKGFFVLGGDDGSQVGVPPEEHRGFSKKVLRFDVERSRFEPQGESPIARVTLPCFAWKGGWILPSGETRPGIRSPEVWQWRPVAAP